MTAIAALPRWLQWTTLIIVSLGFAFVLEWAQFPAAFLVGPMLSAIVFGVSGAVIRMPHRAFVVSQAIVACLIASSLSPEFLPAFRANWPLLIGSVVITLGASSLLCWLISS